LQALHLEQLQQMVDIISLWDWNFFIIALFTLIVIQFLEEYRKHKKINFNSFVKYTKVFWIFNILYVLFGATFATIAGILLNPNNPIAAIIYAAGWEGLLSSIISNKNQGGRTP
jgi:uncharacterized membrane protein YjjP (DUF1212 family)